LLLIYRKYYGTALTLRLLGVFWLVMSTAGLVVHGLFAAAHAVPAASAHADIAHPMFSWNYTTYLNLAFIAVFGVIVWLSRQHNDASDDAYAIDPVCGMQVQKANAPAHRRVNGEDYWFCSDRCAERFDSELKRGGGLDDGGDDPVPVRLGFARHRHEVDDAEDRRDARDRE
jgi:hypothetical protein